MKLFIEYCGLDCESCKARLAMIISNNKQALSNLKSEKN